MKCNFYVTGTYVSDPAKTDVPVVLATVMVEVDVNAIGVSVKAAHLVPSEVQMIAASPNVLTV